MFLSSTGGGTDGEWLRYHILTKRELISPVVARPENAEQAPVAPATAASEPASDDAPEAKRPWWKFW